MKTMITILVLAVASFLFTILVAIVNKEFAHLILILSLGPFVLIIGLIAIMAEEKSKEDFLTEDDLEDDVLYGLVKKYRFREIDGYTELFLLRNLNNQRSAIYKLACVPASICRGWDIKNFSQIKKAIE